MSRYSLIDDARRHVGARAAARRRRRAGSARSTVRAARAASPAVSAAGSSASSSLAVGGDAADDVGEQRGIGLAVTARRRSRARGGARTNSRDHRFGVAPASARSDRAPAPRRAARRCAGARAGLGARAVGVVAAHRSPMAEAGACSSIIARQARAASPPLFCAVDARRAPAPAPRSRRSGCRSRWRARARPPDPAARARSRRRHSRNASSRRG